MQDSMERDAAALMNDNIREPNISRRSKRTKQASLDTSEKLVGSRKRSEPEVVLVEDVESNTTLDPNEPIVDREDPNVKPKILRTSWHARQKESLLSDFNSKYLQSEDATPLSNITSKGEPSIPPAITLPPSYPKHYELYKQLHHPSLTKQYSVKPRVVNVMVFILRDGWLDNEDSTSVANIDPDFEALVHGVENARGVDFSSLREPR